MKTLRILACTILFFTPLISFADGDETLGPPSIPIASGTGVVGSGTGTLALPGNININVPAGVTVKQVLLYWEGFGTFGQNDDTISANGIDVNGTLLGGPTLFFPGNFSSTFRADITGLGLVGPGANVITISDMFFNSRNNGAGILVIYDDGSVAQQIDLRDGNDLAFINFASPLDTTVPQTFNYTSAGSDRIAEMTMFFSSIEDGALRPSTILVTIDGMEQEYVNQLNNSDGDSWDTLTISIFLPAGSSSLTVQALSDDRDVTGLLPASFVWSAAALRVPPGDNPVALGDRVWEDLDRDGQQGCIDGGANDPMFPADGIVGNAGDSGPECNTGVPGVVVDLYEGPDCLVAAGPSTVTDVNGFYLFDNLQPGEYCVRFAKETVDPDFCVVEIDGMLVNLGQPQFTAQNEGDDATDSDADPVSGFSTSVNVGSGSDLTIDAGLFCPAKLGNQVWTDTDEDGIQDPGEPGVPGVEVELVECGPDGVAGTPDDVATGEIRITDETGMYMFGGENNYELFPGDYYVIFDPATLPPGNGFTMPKQGGDDTVDSDCLIPGGETACANVSGSRSVNLDRDCGIVPPPEPECGLTLDKTCLIEVPEPPPGDFDKCAGKLQQFSVTYTGAGPVTVNGAGVSNLAVANGQTVTFTGPYSVNDQIVQIVGAINGQSTFHVSCSDPDFNSPDDCGKVAGNGKDDKDPDGLNVWTLAGFIDSEGRVLNCGGGDNGGNDDGFADNCEFTPGPTPSCDTVEKPNTLTWRYDGGGSAAGGCDGSTFETAVNAKGKSHEDYSCAGSVGLGMEITAIDDDGTAYLVSPGGTFTTPREAIENISLVQDGGAMQQDLTFHKSCSQPLEAGLTGGALTLIALDGNSGGADVTYKYNVMNTGDPLTNVQVNDDKLGNVGSVAALGTGESVSFTASALLSGTTINVATASGMLASGAQCAPASATDQVTVEAIEPVVQCAVTSKFKEVKKDEAVKYELQNTSAFPATLDEFVLNFPAGYQAIKEVKLDGAIYKVGDSNLVVGSGVTISGSDWTNSDKSKRVLDPGEKRTLEVKFTKKFKGAVAGDFSGNLIFEEDCSVAL